MNVGAEELESCVTRGRRRTTKLTDRHELTYENQKLQGKSPRANGGSVQRLVRPWLIHGD